MRRGYRPGIAFRPHSKENISDTTTMFHGPLPAVTARSCFTLRHTERDQQSENARPRAEPIQSQNTDDRDTPASQGDEPPERTGLQAKRSVRPQRLGRNSSSGFFGLMGLVGGTRLDDSLLVPRICEAPREELRQAGLGRRAAWGGQARAGNTARAEGLTRSSARLSSGAPFDGSPPTTRSPETATAADAAARGTHAHAHCGETPAATAQRGGGKSRWRARAAHRRYPARPRWCSSPARSSGRSRSRPCASRSQPGCAAVLEQPSRGRAPCLPVPPSASQCFRAAVPLTFSSCSDTPAQATAPAAAAFVPPPPQLKSRSALAAGNFSKTSLGLRASSTLWPAESEIH